MKFLAIEKETNVPKPKEYQEILKAEAAEIWRLYKLQIIREIYFNEMHNAVIIIECRNLDEALKHLDNLPLVKEKIIFFDIMELKPYSGFDRLFTDNFTF